MKRIACGLLFATIAGFTSGCSNAPVAGFLDNCFPSRARSGIGDDSPRPPVDPRPGPAPAPAPRPGPNPNPIPPPDFGPN